MFSVIYDMFILRTMEGCEVIKIINEVLKILGITTLVNLVWQALELVMIGKIMPDKVDTIIGLILTLSLYVNLKIWDIFSS